MNVRFEWDPAKAASNLRNHRLSFEMAARAFADPFALTEFDRVEGGEQRWQALRAVGGGLLLSLVARAVREEEECNQMIEIIRIISARRADGKEWRRYEQETH